MKFEQIKDELPEGFHRLTGIKRITFGVMITILNEAEVRLKAQGGKPNKLSIEDRLLMALAYLREYRTYFHISRSYGLSESACYRNIRWIEDTLIKDGRFSLPGGKALLKSDVDYEVCNGQVNSDTFLKNFFTQFVPTDAPLLRFVHCLRPRRPGAPTQAVL